MASGGKLARARWSGEAVAGSRNMQSTVILGLHCDPTSYNLY